MHYDHRGLSREPDPSLPGLADVQVCLRQANAAQRLMERASQADCDRWARAVAEAGAREAEHLAQLAVRDSGFGVVADKTRKNLFASIGAWRQIADIPTAGVIARDPERGIVEVAAPAGVVAAVIPITNPTSTTLFKCMIALKARCAIVVSPHPRGLRCIAEACRVAYEAARAAGAPEGCIRCLAQPSALTTRALMGHSSTALVLATGGPGLVRAAHASGTPAIGVGAGNTPAFLHRSADLERAVELVVESLRFDNGVICSSERSVVCERGVSARVLELFANAGAKILAPDEVAKLEAVALRRGRFNPELVGRSAQAVARVAGIAVPEDTTVLVCPYRGVGPAYPLSGEKLAPVLSFYVVDGEGPAIAKCRELLNFAGRGHSAVIHARDPELIERFGLELPASRILVNCGASLGAIGFASALAPSMVLGCGTFGGNGHSDNIGPRHLLNIKRIASARQGNQSQR